MSKSTDQLRVPFHRADVGEDEIAAVSAVIRSGWLTMGAKTFEFEKDFARYVGASHAIAVSSCTAALHLALEAIGLKPGDEVLVPSTTFTATAEAVTYVQCRPVLVDVDATSMNIDPQDARRRITSRTRAIVPVHLGGQPCNLAAIQSLADEHNLAVIEDAAHALPTLYNGKFVGSISDLTAFSFYATKPLTTGEGGMVTTNNDTFADRIRLMRLHGISRDAWNRYSSEGDWFYEVHEAGYKYNFTDLQAAIGSVQLAKCDTARASRANIAARYSSAFALLSALEIPVVPAENSSSWHLYILRLRSGPLRIGRDEFIRELNSRGIGASVHFIPLHLQPYYQRAFGYRKGDLPQSEAQYQRCLSLPIYPAMQPVDIDNVISAVQEICCLYQTHEDAPSPTNHVANAG